MTELQLYKWIQDVEYGIYKKEWGSVTDMTAFTEENSKDWQVLVYPNTGSKLDGFIEICGADFFDDGGMTVTLKHGYVVFDLMPVMDYFDIDPKNIFS